MNNNKIGNNQYKFPSIEKYILEEFYIRRFFTIRQISEILNKGYKSVFNHIKYYKISTRTHKNKYYIKRYGLQKGTKIGINTRFKKGIDHPKHMLGKHHSDKSRKKISDNQKGKIISKQTKEKMSESRLKGLREGRIKTWNKEIPCKESTKNKIREARLKQVFPIEDTIPEKKVQEFLKQNNIKFEKHKAILGQPDIFVKPNICIFVDGCYWHGCSICYSDRNKLNNIQRHNITKDMIVTQGLINQGYRVIRIWEHETKHIKKIEMINKVVIL